MSTNDPIVVTAATRTPMGGMLGMLSPLSGAQLGAFAIKAAIERSGLAADAVDEAIMGCCLPAGQGQAPARQAVRGAGLADATGATTINKMCGSGLKAVMLAHDLIKAGSAGIVVAGGMESMTNAPYLMLKGRSGYRYGHSELLDHLALDGLEDAYEKRTPMGVFAERTAEQFGFSREQQDEFAIASLARAKRANEDGSFAFEMAPVEIAGRDGVERIERDEQPFKGRPDKIPTLKPAFKKDGTITAANASSISDGGAALTVMSASRADKLGARPLARIVAHATHARLPAEFSIAPVYAISDVLAKAGWSVGDVDLWEINEAFAVVTMAAMKEHGLAHDTVNIHGGACALGHPIGASGARIAATLLGALKKTGGKRGIASLCIGGGEAVAVAFEML
ncbi:acetyl-CoA C-acyltransferase [Sinimarinibacterium sp. CAU 1509]|nr:acetyl-CoA C-acyltransferase [Sinimarinibacterium sp. CAU 1509]TJY56643.1 acetyl-CoA C-acyltransferase [Sinimarinibacterium sp. CAU 1509]